MNRQIKFRVWCISGKQFLSQKELGNFWIRPHDFNSCFMEWLPDWDGETVFETKETDFIYQQWTGLLDKNGKEIYEGDILKTEYNVSCADLRNGESTITIEGCEPGHYTVKRSAIHVVKWAKTSFDLGGIHKIGWYRIGEKEIVGNIFENPELLE